MEPLYIARDGFKRVHDRSEPTFTGEQNRLVDVWTASTKFGITYSEGQSARLRSWTAHPMQTPFEFPFMLQDLLGVVPRALPPASDDLVEDYLKCAELQIVRFVEGDVDGNRTVTVGWKMGTPNSRSQMEGEWDFLPEYHWVMTRGVVYNFRATQRTAAWRIVYDYDFTSDPVPAVKGGELSFLQDDVWRTHTRTTVTDFSFEPPPREVFTMAHYGAEPTAWWHWRTASIILATSMGAFLIVLFKIRGGAALHLGKTITTRLDERRQMPSPQH